MRGVLPKVAEPFAVSMMVVPDETFLSVDPACFNDWNVSHTTNSTGVCRGSGDDE